jgi:hypothetical protein
MVIAAVNAFLLTTCILGYLGVKKVNLFLIFKIFSDFIKKKIHFCSTEKEVSGHFICDWNNFGLSITDHVDW